MSSPTVLVITLLLSSIIGLSNSQSLKAEYMGYLPYGFGYVQPIYDGNDHIYLFGATGLDGPLYRYTLSNGFLQNLGPLPGVVYMGTAQSDRNGNIFYFGGLNRQIYEYVDIFKFNPATNLTLNMGSLPYSVAYSSSVMYNLRSNLIHIFGGVGGAEGILEVNLDTLEVVNATPFPFKIYTQSTVIVGEKAFMFGFTDDSPQSIFTITKDPIRVSAGPSDFPKMLYNPSSVFDNDAHIYVIGGYDSNAGIGRNGIIQVNVDTLQHKFLPVANFFVGQEAFDYIAFAPATVYVEKLNRIYFFGGRTWRENSGHHDHNEIWFIDLNPVKNATSKSY